NHTRDNYLREDGTDPVVRQRGGDVGELVVRELLPRPLEGVLERTPAELPRVLRDPVLVDRPEAVVLGADRLLDAAVVVVRHAVSFRDVGRALGLLRTGPIRRVSLVTRHPSRAGR